MNRKSSIKLLSFLFCFALLFTVFSNRVTHAEIDPPNCPAAGCISCAREGSKKSDESDWCDKNENDIKDPDEILTFCDCCEGYGEGDEGYCNVCIDEAICGSEGDEPDPDPDPGSCEAPPPATGSNFVEGRAEKIYTIPMPDGSLKKTREPLDGITVAWIEDPNLPDKNGNRDSDLQYTYKKATSTLGDSNSDGKSDSYYRIDGLPSTTTFLTFYCGNEILDTYAVTWKDGNGNSFTSAEIPITVFKNMTCSTADVCLRPSPDETEYACVTPAETNLKTPVEYLKEPPKVTPTLDVAWCIANFSDCFLGVFDFSVAYVLGQTHMVTDEVNSARDMHAEATTASTGCDPRVGQEDGIPSCESIRSINVASRGEESGKCGRSWIKRAAPSTLASMVENLGDPLVCRDDDDPLDPDIYLSDIQPPVWSSRVSRERELSAYRKSHDYWPYYLFKPSDLDKGESAPSLAAEVDAGSEEGSCSGYDCKPGDPSSESGSTTDVWFKGNAWSLVGAFVGGGKTAGSNTSPSRSVYDPKDPKSGIYRVGMFGEECACPIPGSGKSETRIGGVCTQGGINYTLVDYVEASICSDPDSLLNDPACAIYAEKKAFISMHIPRAREIGAAGANYCNVLIRPGGKKVKNIGGMGTVSAIGGVEEANRPVPYGVEGLGTFAACKEEAAKRVDRPRN